MPNIEIIELLNGEKLIGLILEKSDSTITIQEPFVIAPQQQGQNGQVNFAFVPWPVFRDVNESEFNVNRDMVIVTYAPNNQITDHYNRATAQKSGLILPPSITPVTGTNFIRD